MEKTQALENFIQNWNGIFPNYPLTIDKLKRPHAVMSALFQVFDRLGIDREAVLTRPPEETHNENTIYYWDLFPVINMTRVMNYLVSVMPQVATISITQFLQPTATTSNSLLLLVFIMMTFNEQRLRSIAPYEEELFSRNELVKTLEDKKNRLLQMLNEQAEEKGKRSERLEELDYETKQLEEELKQENEALAEEKLELETILKENHQTDILLEQKKSQRDALVAEIEKKQALRVYDAEDIKAQATQAAQNVQDAEEKLNSLKAVLMQKENSLNNLQTIKPYLDTANNLLHEIITKLSESSKDYDNGDLDMDSQEGELDVLNTELSEIDVQLEEIKVAREEANKKRKASQAKRQHERTLAQSKLREAEENDRKCKEKLKISCPRLQEVKDLTMKYEQERADGFKDLELIKDNFNNELKTLEEALLKKMLESKENIEEKLRKRNI